MRKTFVDSCDVLLVADRDGWIYTICNVEGRRAVERIFLDLPIKWVPATELGITRERDWSVADLNIATMVKLTEDASRMYEPADGQCIVPQDRVLPFGIAIYEQDKRLRIIIAKEDDEGDVVFNHLQITIDKVQ